jgi:hypothetical protein
MLDREILCSWVKMFFMVKGGVGYVIPLELHMEESVLVLMGQGAG